VDSGRGGKPASLQRHRDEVQEEKAYADRYYGEIPAKALNRSAGCAPRITVFRREYVVWYAQPRKIKGKN